MICVSDVVCAVTVARVLHFSYELRRLEEFSGEPRKQKYFVDLSRALPL